ncbi:MAG: hypothetical protein H7Y15_15250, partial [Pseudonocardia sp.]|nr:hypothetical protein [Pseudonocardia sp.]
MPVAELFGVTEFDPLRIDGAGDPVMLTEPSSAAALLDITGAADAASPGTTATGPGGVDVFQGDGLRLAGWPFGDPPTVEPAEEAAGIIQNTARDVLAEEMPAGGDYTPRTEDRPATVRVRNGFLLDGTGVRVGEDGTIFLTPPTPAEDREGIDTGPRSGLEDAGVRAASNPSGGFLTSTDSAELLADVGEVGRRQVIAPDSGSGTDLFGTTGAGDGLLVADRPVVEPAREGAERINRAAEDTLFRQMPASSGVTPATGDRPAGVVRDGGFASDGTRIRLREDGSVIVPGSTRLEDLPVEDTDPRGPQSRLDSAAVLVAANPVTEDFRIVSDSGSGWLDPERAGDARSSVMSPELAALLDIPGADDEIVPAGAVDGPRGGPTVGWSGPELTAEIDRMVVSGSPTRVLAAAPPSEPAGSGGGRDGTISAPAENLDGIDPGNDALREGGLRQRDVDYGANLTSVLEDVDLSSGNVLVIGNTGHPFPEAEAAAAAGFQTVLRTDGVDPATPGANSLTEQRNTAQLPPTGAYGPFRGLYIGTDAHRDAMSPEGPGRLGPDAIPQDPDVTQVVVLTEAPFGQVAGEPWTVNPYDDDDDLAPLSWYQQRGVQVRNYGLDPRVPGSEPDFDSYMLRRSSATPDSPSTLESGQPTRPLSDGTADQRDQAGAPVTDALNRVSSRQVGMDLDRLRDEGTLVAGPLAGNIPTPLFTRTTMEELDTAVRNNDLTFSGMALDRNLTSVPQGGGRDGDDEEVPAPAGDGPRNGDGVGRTGPELTAEIDRMVAGASDGTPQAVSAGEPGGAVPPVYFTDPSAEGGTPPQSGGSSTVIAQLAGSIDPVQPGDAEPSGTGVPDGAGGGGPIMSTVVDGTGSPGDWYSARLGRTPEELVGTWLTETQDVPTNYAEVGSLYFPEQIIAPANRPTAGWVNTTLADQLPSRADGTETTFQEDMQESLARLDVEARTVLDPSAATDELVFGLRDLGTALQDPAVPLVSTGNPGTRQEGRDAATALLNLRAQQSPSGDPLTSAMQFTEAMCVLGQACGSLTDDQVVSLQYAVDQGADLQQAGLEVARDNALTSGSRSGGSLRDQRYRECVGQLCGADSLLGDVLSIPVDPGVTGSDALGALGVVPQGVVAAPLTSLLTRNPAVSELSRGRPTTPSNVLRGEEYVRETQQTLAGLGIDPGQLTLPNDENRQVALRSAQDAYGTAVREFQADPSSAAAQQTYEDYLASTAGLYGEMFPERQAGRPVIGRTAETGVAAEGDPRALFQQGQDIVLGELYRQFGNQDLSFDEFTSVLDDGGIPGGSAADPVTMTSFGGRDPGDVGDDRTIPFLNRPVEPGEVVTYLVDPGDGAAGVRLDTLDGTSRNLPRTDGTIAASLTVGETNPRFSVAIGDTPTGEDVLNLDVGRYGGTLSNENEVLSFARSFPTFRFGDARIDYELPLEHEFELSPYMDQEIDVERAAVSVTCPDGMCLTVTASGNATVTRPGRPTESITPFLPLGFDQVPEATSDPETPANTASGSPGVTELLESPDISRNADPVFDTRTAGLTFLPELAALDAGSRPGRTVGTTPNPGTAESSSTST